MENIAVEFYSETASFRDPNFQNFQKSLNLPSPSNIIGMIGAALGISAKLAQAEVMEHELQFGVYGKHQGRMKDLWKYAKVKKDFHKYKPKDGSVLTREHLVQNSFYMVFFCKEEAFINRLYEAFENPFFCLTMGNSDALAKIKKIHINCPAAKCREFENCILEGDILQNVVENLNASAEFSLYEAETPIANILPVFFDYKSHYGKRTVKSTKTFSFITNKVKLNYDVTSLKVDSTLIPLNSFLE